MRENIDEMRKMLKDNGVIWFSVSGRLCYMALEGNGKVKGIEYFTVYEGGRRRPIYPLSEKLFDSVDEAMKSLDSLKNKRIKIIKTN